MVSKFLKYSALSICMASVLTACGGGSSDNSSTTPLNQGRAVDGPLKNALVTFLECSDKSEVRTRDDGTFDIPTACVGKDITITGGVDTATNMPFRGTLKAKAPTSTTATAIVSPLTTLVSAGGTDQQVRDLLGITDESVNIAFLDPMTNQDIYAKTVQIQQLAEEIQNTISTLGGSYSDEQLNTASFEALAKFLKEPSSLTDEGVIKDAIKATINSDVIQETLTVEFKKPNVAENLAALSASLIKRNVENVGEAIRNVNIFTATGLLAESSEEIKNAKESPIVENLLNTFSDYLHRPNIAGSLSLLAKDIANPEIVVDYSDHIADIQTAIQQEDPNFEMPSSIYNNLSNIETTKIKKYTNLNYGTYSLKSLKETTIDTPLFVGLNDDIFKQEIAISSENMSNKRDTIKLAFEVKILNSNTHKEVGSINGIIDQVVLTFNSQGQISKANLPINTYLELNASVPNELGTANKSKNYIVQSPIELAVDNLNKLSLEALLNSNSSFASTYADYAHHLDGSYKFDSTIYIKSNNITIDNTYLTSNAKVLFGANKYRFEGYSINAFFTNYQE